MGEVQDVRRAHHPFVEAPDRRRAEGSRVDELYGLVLLDAVHDGFAAALTRRTSFRGDGTIEGWLWAVVVNARPKPPPCRRSPPGRRGARCSCGRGCRPAHSGGGRRPPGWLLLAAALVIPTGLAVAGAGQGVVHYLPGPATPAERAIGRLL